MRPRRRAPIRATKKQPNKGESWSRLLIVFAAAGFLFWAVASRSDQLSSFTSSPAIQKDLALLKKGELALLKKMHLIGAENETAASAEDAASSEGDEKTTFGDQAATQTEEKPQEEPQSESRELNESQEDKKEAQKEEAQKSAEVPKRKRKRSGFPRWGPGKKGKFDMPTFDKPKKSFLETSIVRDDLVPVYLDSSRFGTEETNLQPGATPPEATKGTPCPVFEYSYEGFEESIGTCWKKPIEDGMRTPTMYPANCASLDSSCVQDTDFQPHERWSAQVLVLHDVYVNVAGQIFNRTHFFDHNACSASQKFSHPASKTRVHSFPLLLSFVDWFAWNARSHLLDLLPLFVPLEPVLTAFPGLPVAFGHRLTHRRNQLQQMVAQGAEEVLGVSLERRLDTHILQGTDLFYAEKMIVPLHQRCGRPSRSLWQHIRARHLLPADGLPMFNPDFSTTSRTTNPPPASDFTAGQNWVAVVVTRDEPKPLVESLKLADELRRLIPSVRVEVYREGSLTLTRRKELLGKALLLVAAHGNSLADMIFMPPGGAVIEFRPAEDPDPTFHHLAEVCGLEYHLLLAHYTGKAGKGRKKGPSGGAMAVEDPKAALRLVQDVSKKVLAKASVEVQ